MPGGAPLDVRTCPLDVPPGRAPLTCPLDVPRGPGLAPSKLGKMSLQALGVAFRAYGDRLASPALLSPAVRSPCCCVVLCAPCGLVRHAQGRTHGFGARTWPASITVPFGTVPYSPFIA